MFFTKTPSKVWRWVALASLLSTSALAQEAIQEELEEEEGEWVFSPSVSLELGQSSVDGDLPQLQRSNAVALAMLNGDLKYNGRFLESKLINETMFQRYSEDEEFNWVTSNWLWQNEYPLLDNSLVLSHLFIKKVQLFDTIRGAFADEWYAKDNGATRYQRNYRANYRLPEAAPVDANIRYTHNEADLKVPDDYDVVGFGSVVNSDYEQRRLATEVGHYRGVQRLKWRLKLNRDLTIRQQDNRFLVYEGRARASYPIYDNWNAVGTGYYSRHENPDGFEYGVEQDLIEYRTAGFGIAWQSPRAEKRLQITHEWDHSNDLTFWGGEADWRFSDRWRLSGFVSRRFYGDAGGMDLYYERDRNRFSVSYEEAVEIDFFLLPDSELIGLFICDAVEGLDNTYDPERCTSPEALNTLLGDNQYLSIQRRGIYPVEERLVLRKGWSARWDYVGAKWSHTIYGFDREQQDLELDWVQQNQEALFEGDYRFASNYFLKGKFHFRSTALFPSLKGSRNRLYSVGYHHELNSRANWSVTLMHINQDSTANIFTYDENRIVFGYTHHFGRVNRHRRDLHEFDRRPGAVDYGINTGW